jgi:hypothetical protein
MILAGVAAFLMLAWAPPPASKQMRPAGGRMSLREQIIIRIPTGLRRASPESAARWRERSGPRCVPANRIIGAAHPGAGSVDLIFRDQSRVRVRLNRGCAALDYYRGFYVSATEDGQICADRDAIRARTGGECQIDQFRRLTPAR